MDITFIILTKNEELHLARCIKNITDIASRIVVVDSFSEDRTREIALEMGAEVYENPWEGSYAKQFNWALNHTNINTSWVFRLDADEYLTEELIKELQSIDEVPENITGLIIKRRHIFLEKWVKYGVYPVPLLRLFRVGVGLCEEKWMDEHIVLKAGVTDFLKYDFVDHSLKSFRWWLFKHIDYSYREAIDLLNIELQFLGRKNLDKENLTPKMKKLYVRSPLFIRCVFYFFVRYIFKLGFKDGIKGLIWHFFQGLFYRMLVDVHIYRIKMECGNDVDLIANWFLVHAGLNIHSLAE